MRYTMEFVWRCVACGKWSHAKRMPRSHKRYVGGGSYGEGEAQFVDCGPFQSYVASPLASSITEYSDKEPIE